jgi:hypothetical protein
VNQKRKENCEVAEKRLTKQDSNSQPSGLRQTQEMGVFDQVRSGPQSQVGDDKDGSGNTG